MSANDETKSDAKKSPAEDAKASSGPTIEHEDPAPAKVSPFVRKLKFYGILLAIVVVALVAAAGSYPYWRAKAAPVVAKVGFDLENLEKRLRIPRWAITHGREAPKAETEAKASAPAAPTKPNPDPKPAPPEPTAAVKAEAPPSVPDKVVSSAETEALSERISSVQSRISALEDRLGALENANAQAGSKDSGAGPAATAQIPSDLPGQLEALAARLAALEASKPAAGSEKPSAHAADNSALIGTVVALAERVAAMEGRRSAGASEVEALRKDTLSLAERLNGLNDTVKQVGATMAKKTPGRDRASLLLLSVGQLAAATSGSGPFSAQLQAVRAATGDKDDLTTPLDRLEPIAKAGAPTVVALRAAFTRASEAVVRSRDVGSAKGIVGQTLTRVASLVTIRKVDDPGSATVDGALAAADAALAAGDLGTAVAAMKTLEGAPGEAIADWLSQAQARLTVNQSVSELQSAAVKALAAAG